MHTIIVKKKSNINLFLLLNKKRTKKENKSNDFFLFLHKHLNFLVFTY